MNITKAKEILGEKFAFTSEFANKEKNPLHPHAADPNEYIQGLNLASQKMEGAFFDAFIFQKQ